jgi:branched-chain amino acid transport system ATP-binding protein
MLEVEDVSVRYGGITALSHVSMRLANGKVRGLIGPNGAGKTTLLDVISGITMASSGRILLDGSEVTRHSIEWRSRHGIARTFQRLQLFGLLTVEENLLAALEWEGGGAGLLGDALLLPRRRRHERLRRVRVGEILDVCGIEKQMWGRRANTLPLGAGRLVELARALVGRPSALLLDEPTSGLEENDVDRVGEIVQNMARELNCAVGIVEHNIGFVMNLCSEIVVLESGQILAEGDPASISTDPAVVEAYLG